MGLDMYLDKYPRYKDTTPAQIAAMEGYFELKDEQSGGGYLDCSLKSWCGCEEKDLPVQAVMDFYRPLYTKHYSAWNHEKKYGHNSIHQNIAYWRKANQIHAWFVQNIQGGEDDCGAYVVSKESLEKLLDICKTLKSKVKLVPGKVVNGYTYTSDGKEEECTEDGYIVANPDVCAELLPSQSGFFFGSTSYDAYYMTDIDYTIEALEKVLAETDFENEVVFYNASW